MDLAQKVGETMDEVGYTTDAYRRKIYRIAQKYTKYDQNEDLDEAMDAFYDFLAELNEYVEEVKKALHGFDEYFESIGEKSPV